MSVKVYKPAFYSSITFEGKKEKKRKINKDETEARIMEFLIQGHISMRILFIRKISNVNSKMISSFY